MAAISETIVREYFELHEFLVRQFRKHTAPAGREDDDPDFLVLNPNAQAGEVKLPFVLGSPDLARVSRGIVVIKAWHTEVFSPSFFAHSPGFFRFLEKKAFLNACRTFRQPDGRPPLKLLVISSLSQDAAAQQESAAILKSRGIDAVLSFRTMLADLVARVEPSRNYLKSDLLQTLRILKHYEFFKDPQMDLFRPRRSRSHAARSVAPPEAE
ncbi:MAG TPA: hypothetical protein P5038_17090 [Candidatus Paceibacterota bacterium]|nr:hypothetical protein [Candidatus Paceibacterota bacterium]HRT58343.1 hypothetical protein [Candidatus Paceibacterota bacterium]